MITMIVVRFSIHNRVWTNSSNFFEKNQNDDHDDDNGYYCYYFHSSLNFVEKIILVFVFVSLPGQYLDDNQWKKNHYSLIQSISFI